MGRGLYRRGSPVGAPARKSLPPFPKQQLFILALCRICEPIAFMGIFPYIYFMVKDFHMTEDESKIALYAGMVTSAFTFAEFSTGFLWGKLSDRVGRKPILLTGLSGTALSVLIFGFAPNIYVALFARALGGLLNGNIGVIQTTVAELVTVKEHQPRAYTVMPIVWCLGSIIGPIIGGALAKPCILYPALFPRGSIWDRFPYLLPNVFSALAVLVGVIIGILFFEETHAEKKKRRDFGVELGNALIARAGQLKCLVCRLWRHDRQPSKAEEQQPLLFDHDEPLPGYQTNENSPHIRSISGPEPSEALDLAADAVPTAVHVPAMVPVENQAPPTQIFTKPVVLNIISYGIMAFHTMTYDQMLPVFLSTPPQHGKGISLPFKFSDGFGYDTDTVGIVLAVQGVYSMISTMVLFPIAARRLGELRLFRLLAVFYFALYFVTPYLVLLPEKLRMAGIVVVIAWKCTFSTMAYPANAILLTNSAPTLLSLGTINGVAASTASLCRAFGPTISGMLYAAGLETGYSGLAWWCSGLVTIVGAFVSLQITQPRGRMDEKSDEDDIEAVAAQSDDETRTLVETEAERPTPR